jgi:lipopolysaccharide export system protein LptA
MTVAVCAVALYAETVNITANAFEADEAKRISRFDGNVSMTKGKDWLRADQVLVYFDQKNRPQKYEAIGHVSFEIHMKNGTRYLGRSRKLSYRPHGEVYRLEGGVVLEEPALGRTLKGERVVVEKISGRARVDGGGNRPVSFTFRVEEEKK